MNVAATALPDVLLVVPRVYRDDRGYFLESWNQERYRGAGLPADFVQDNLSYSRRGVLRGLHYQLPHEQGKLVSVVRGAVFDVAVDVRLDSPTFGRWTGQVLSAENAHQLYVPPGFAHGFVVTSDEALVSYKCTDVYSPASEGAVAWDDPDVGIAWPVANPVLNAKDAAAPRLRDIPRDRLPRVRALQRASADARSAHPAPQQLADS